MENVLKNYTNNNIPLSKLLTTKQYLELKDIIRTSDINNRPLYRFVSRQFIIDTLKGNDFIFLNISSFSSNFNFICDLAKQDKNTDNIILKIQANNKAVCINNDSDYTDEYEFLTFGKMELVKEYEDSINEITIFEFKQCDLGNKFNVSRAFKVKYTDINPNLLSILSKHIVSCIDKIKGIK